MVADPVEPLHRLCRCRAAQGIVRVFNSFGEEAGDPPIQPKSLYKCGQEPHLSNSSWNASPPFVSAAIFPRFEAELCERAQQPSMFDQGLCSFAQSCSGISFLNAFFVAQAGLPDTGVIILTRAHITFAITFPEWGPKGGRLGTGVTEPRLMRNFGESGQRVVSFVPRDRGGAVSAHGSIPVPAE